MPLIVASALTAIIAITCTAFLWYWLGVRVEQQRTRAWARRAITAESIAGLLQMANNDLVATCRSRELGERPLDPEEFARLLALEYSLTEQGTPQ
jgi:hypothetical protein